MQREQGGARRWCTYCTSVAGWATSAIRRSTILVLPPIAASTSGSPSTGGALDQRSQRQRLGAASLLSWSGRGREGGGRSAGSSAGRSRHGCAPSARQVDPDESPARDQTDGAQPALWPSKSTPT